MGPSRSSAKLFCALESTFFMPSASKQHSILRFYDHSEISIFFFMLHRTPHLFIPDASSHKMVTRMPKADSIYQRIMMKRSYSKEKKGKNHVIGFCLGVIIWKVMRL